MKPEEIKLNRNVRLVSFATKGGIYVYEDNILVGCLVASNIVEQAKGGQIK